MVALGLAGSFTLLLVSLTDLKLDALPRAYDCLLESYYGIHGGRHAFILDESCRTSSFSLLGVGTTVALDPGLVRSTVERQNGLPRYVFNPDARYADPMVAAWAAYYAHGGRDPAGAKHFVSVPGVKTEDGPTFFSEDFDAPPKAGLTGRLVWFERTHVDPALYGAPFDVELDWVLGNLTVPSFLSRPQIAPTDPALQLVLDAPGAPDTQPFEIQVAYRSSDGVLLAVPDAVLASLDAAGVPLRFWRYSVPPNIPVPVYPVPEEAKEKLRAAMSNIKFDPAVASVVDGISVSQLKSDIRHLTGEDPSSDIESRRTLSAGALRAAAWLRDRIEETGARCEFNVFREGWAPNVVCTYAPSTDTTETIVLGAHYDDCGSFGNPRAPGANDDASGTGALVGIARAIARAGVVFRKRVQLIAFAGEEQGMIGSQEYVRGLKEAGADITMMVQADMIAFHAEGERPQLGLSDPALVGTDEVGQILANVSALYSPELLVGYAPYPGGSDHQRFYEYGYPSAQMCDRAGVNKDTMYHETGDVSDRDGFDFDQVRSIAKVGLAAALHVAGFDLS